MADFFVDTLPNSHKLCIIYLLVIIPKSFDLSQIRKALNYNITHNEIVIPSRANKHKHRRGEVEQINMEHRAFLLHRPTVLAEKVQHVQGGIPKIRC